MKAMVLDTLERIGDDSRPPEILEGKYAGLRAAELPDPVPAPGEILVQVSACGVCHTELDEIEGRLPPPRLPVILGHQVVGRVAGLGAGAGQFRLGDRVGIAWIYSACGQCPYCLAGEENLCPDFRATGRDADGGYAELTVVPERFAHPIPDVLADAEAAPLLCAGAIGYRSLRLARLQDGEPIGLTGFGASAHLVLKLIQFRYPGSAIYVFARDEDQRAFALELGATWAGDTTGTAPVGLAAVIDTTPAWTPVVEGLRNLAPGGRLVINAIRKEDADRHVLSEIDYPSGLWLEKEIKSVANVTRRDVTEFLELAAAIPIRPEYQEYRLEDANVALLELKQRKIRGAKVLRTN